MNKGTWLITGVSSGFGYEMTKQLLERGDTVIGTVRKTESVKPFLSQFPNTFFCELLDMTDTAGVRALVNTAFARHGNIDVVVSNAGYGLFGAAEEVSDAEVLHIISTNLTGSIALIRAALPHLRRQGGGRVIQLSTYGGQVAFPGNAMYHATKWGIEGFCEAVAQEVAPFGIGMTIVEPGGARTEFRYGSAKVATLMPEYDATPAHNFKAMLDPANGLPPAIPPKWQPASLRVRIFRPRPCAWCLVHRHLPAHFRCSKPVLQTLKHKRQLPLLPIIQNKGGLPLRKIIATMLALTLAIGLTACSGTSDAPPPPQSNAPSSSDSIPVGESTSDTTDTPTEESSTPETSDKILIAYFSRMGNMDFDPEVDAVASATVQADGSEYVGNNKIIADMVAEKTGGDVFFIEQTEKYPAAYRATTDQVKEEQNSGARPALVAQVENMEQYSTVILVYPNWWGTLPPAVCTFLESYDFSEKTILPLATHEGSGLGSGPSDIESLCPDATLLEGLSVRGSAVGSADADVETWLEASGLLNQ